jgi:hypothetical protein
MEKRRIEIRYIPTTLGVNELATIVAQLAVA